MSDSKSQYSATAKLAKEMSLKNREVLEILNRGAERAAKYHENWESVNFNTIVKKFAPDAVVAQKGGKVEFQTPGSPIKVVADLAGGYCRIQDMRIDGKRCYLDINGQNASNKTDDKGRQSGRNQAEYNAVTHFRIKKREEM